MIFEGVNDLGQADDIAEGPYGQQFIYDRLIQAYSQIITRCHTFGIPIFASTITPFSGPNYNVTLVYVNVNIPDIILMLLLCFYGFPHSLILPKSHSHIPTNTSLKPPENLKKPPPSTHIQPGLKCKNPRSPKSN